MIKLTITNSTVKAVHIYYAFLIANVLGSQVQLPECYYNMKSITFLVEF